MKKSIYRIASLSLVALAVAAGCKRDDLPVKFEVTVPFLNTTRFQAEITRRYGLGLEGEFSFERYGKLFVSPETPQHGFQFGFLLHTSVFNHESWVNYEEVTALPTGATFPAWMTGPVVEFEVPRIDGDVADFRLYVGTRDRYYVGLAAMIHAIDEKFPSVNIGYTFYDKKGNVVTAVQFFGPKIGSDGRAAVPGGIFVGTDVTPFLPAGFQPADPSEIGTGEGTAIAFDQAMGLVWAANSGEPLVSNGKSLYAEVKVTGRDQGKYKSEKQINSAVSRFAAATRQ